MDLSFFFLILSPSLFVYLSSDIRSNVSTANFFFSLTLSLFPFFYEITRWRDRYLCVSASFLGILLQSTSRIEFKTNDNTISRASANGRTLINRFTARADPIVIEYRINTARDHDKNMLVSREIFFLSLFHLGNIPGTVPEVFFRLNLMNAFASLLSRLFIPRLVSVHNKAAADM